MPKPQILVTLVAKILLLLFKHPVSRINCICPVLALIFIRKLVETNNYKKFNKGTLSKKTPKYIKTYPNNGYNPHPISHKFSTFVR